MFIPRNIAEALDSATAVEMGRYVINCTQYRRKDGKCEGTVTDGRILITVDFTAAHLRAAKQARATVGRESIRSTWQGIEDVNNNFDVLLKRGWHKSLRAVHVAYSKQQQPYYLKEQMAEDELAVALVSRDTKKPLAVHLPVQEGIFPKWERLFELGERKSTNEYFYSPVRFGNLLTTIGKILGPNATVNLSFAADKPALITGESEGVKLRALIMPMNKKE